MSYPQPGEVFELTLDEDVLKKQTLGCDGKLWIEWQYKTKKKIKGRLTRKFQLVSMGYCADWNKLIKKTGGPW